MRFLKILFVFYFNSSFQVKHLNLDPSPIQNREKNNNIQADSGGGGKNETEEL